MDSKSQEASPTDITRRPSHSSPNSSAMSDSPFFTDSCSISPVEPNPRTTFIQSKLQPIPPSIPPRPLQKRRSKYLPDFTSRQWMIFSIFVGTNFLAGMVYNMKGPFYPQEAETKGVNASQYGFVFGIFEFTKVFASPLYGKYMNQLGARRVFIGSLYVVGICSILFGLIDEISNATAFLTCSLLIRVAEAIGSSGYSCALFSIIAHEFPGSVATTFAILEAFFGMGLIVSPPLGGVLFQLAGYPLPFITVGLFIFTSVNFICVIMPHSFTVRDAEGRATEGFGVFKVLKIKGVLFSAVGVLTAACSTGFINATLEPHLRQFLLTPFQTGIVFGIFGLVYSLMAPCLGRVCDRVKEPKYITLLGAISNFVAFLLMGPAPLFKFDTILWVTCVALVLHGVALAGMFVSLFILAFSYSVASGMPNDMKTHSVVSGMFTSVLSLGMFLGPTIGGILFDQVGFRWGSLFVISTMACLIVLIVSYLILQKPIIRPPTVSEEDEIFAEINPKENDPLLIPPSVSVSGKAPSSPINLGITYGSTQVNENN